MASVEAHVQHDVIQAHLEALMRSGPGISSSTRRAFFRDQACLFLETGGSPTPKLLVCRLQSSRLNQSPALHITASAQVTVI